MTEDEQRARLWRRTWVLAAIIIAATLLAVIVLPFAVVPLNTVTVLAFPLGIFLLAQGVVIALVVVVIWFASFQERIDRRHGAMDDI